MKELIHISRKDTENDLYRRLQESSLERLQELSGEVWTDFNPHDPGVTISDVLNYALSEFDFRLRFHPEDYLTEEKRPFEPERFGLFTPLQVFPVDPVIVTDYRKLCVDRIEDLENLWLYPAENAPDGWYDVLAELSPWALMSSREKVEKQIVRLFNSYRNLGEGLRHVNFVRRKPLMLTGDIEIKPGVEVARVLADIYWEARQFFIGGIRYRRLEELLSQGKTPDEILEGPELRHWVIDEDSLQPIVVRYSVAVLFRRLMVLDGVETVRSLGFSDGIREYRDILAVNDPTVSYTVEIPDNREKVKLNVWSGGSRVRVNGSVLPSLLYARYVRCFGKQNRTEDISPLQSYPLGKYRDVSGYSSVQNDFPECYGIDRWGVASGESALRKAQAKQLKGYLLLFDEVIARGLKELQSLPRLLTLESELIEEGVVPLEIPGDLWDLLTDTDRLKKTGNGCNRWLEQKKKLLEMWEGIYGEASNPEWLKEYDYYEETEAECLERRFRFFRRLPEWGRSRFKGVDLTNMEADNVPGIKAYIGCLMGWEVMTEKPVVNVFPVYNLRLVGDDYFYSRPMGSLSHDLVAEDILKPEYMEPVVMPEKAYTESDYLVLRDRLSLFHHNQLFEGLFREGIRAENYCVLNIPEYLDRLLVFHHVQRGGWINLGHFGSQEELEETAGCLRHFLIMLNRKSESMYVVEHLHLQTGEPGDREYCEELSRSKNRWWNRGIPGIFDGEDLREERYGKTGSNDAEVMEESGLTVVFPGWSARMADSHFREECEKLVCTRLPAHMNVRFQWRNVLEMWQFECAYFDWRKALAEGESGENEKRLLREVLGLKQKD